MASQPSFNLLKDIELILRSKIEDQEVFDQAITSIGFALKNYKIEAQTFELAVYTDENIRIINRYKACLMVEGKSQQTIEAYEYQIKRMFNTLQINLKDIGPYDIRYYLAILKQQGTMSNRTLDGVRSYISAFYKWMTVEEIISKNPCLPVKPIKYTDEIKKAFNELDIEKIRASCKTDKERAIIEMLYSTGVRVGELEALNIEDLDFKQNSVRVRHGKGDKERITYMSDIASYYVTRYLHKRRDKGIELFRSNKDDRLLAEGIRWIVHNVGDRAGVPNCHPHRFRRTFATNLNNKGMSLQYIQHLLGHSNMDTTMIYVHVNENAVRSEYMKYMVNC